MEGLLNISRKKAPICPRRFQYQSPTGMIKKVIQSCPEPVEGKAAAILTRGAYCQYVSTTKLRERRWWLFSTFLWRKKGGMPDMTTRKAEGESKTREGTDGSLIAHNQILGLHTSGERSKHRREVLYADRPTKEISLVILAIQTKKNFKLFLFLHALGNHLQVKFMS
jgi:hypothetical protein